MKIIRIIFGAAILFQLGVIAGIWPIDGDFGIRATLVGLVYKSAGFIVFFEILLPRAHLPRKITTAITAVGLSAYIGEMMVENANFYATTLWADIIAHFSAAFLLATMGYLFVSGAPAYKNMPYKRYMVLATLCLIMVVHEIYEYTSDHLFGTFSVSIDDPRYDTMEDLLFGFSGSVCGVWLGSVLEKYMK